MRLHAGLATCITLAYTTILHAERIDFSSLSPTNISDADGQTFAWSGDGRTGTVVVRANWPNMSSESGALRTNPRAPLSFNNPFVGTLTFNFSQPVEVAFLATSASLVRDGLEGGRFEQIRLSTGEPVSFAGIPDTTAIYTGVGTNNIVADDTFSPTPTVSKWGIVGSGAASEFQLQFTSTHIGLSETFDVVVVPEAGSVGLAIFGLIGLVTLRWRTNRPTRP